MKIINYKTDKEISKELYHEIGNISCNCESNKAKLVPNERADASFDYSVICDRCSFLIKKK